MSRIRLYFSIALALTLPSAAGARPAALSSLCSLLRELCPLFNPIMAAYGGPSAKKILSRKFFEHEKYLEEIFQKKKKKSRKFFLDFANFFPVEIIYMMSKLRTQNFTIIGQGVPEIQGVTDGHTEKLF